MELSSNTDLVCHLGTCMDPERYKKQKNLNRRGQGQGRARAGEVLRPYKGSPTWFLISQVNATHIYWSQMLWFKWGISHKELTVLWDRPRWHKQCRTLIGTTRVIRTKCWVGRGERLSNSALKQSLQMRGRGEIWKMSRVLQAERTQGHLTSR